MRPTRQELETHVAKAICREQCAHRGEMPCFNVGASIGEDLPWPPPLCDDPGCVTLAQVAIEAACPTIADQVAREGIYVASKAVHGHEWRALRASGYPILSTWIDESDLGQTNDWTDLWIRCVREASQAAALVLIRRDQETLKGALVEVGAALANGVPVLAVGIEDLSVRHHPGVIRCADELTAWSSALSLVENLRRRSAT